MHEMWTTAIDDSVAWASFSISVTATVLIHSYYYSTVVYSTVQYSTPLCVCVVHMPYGPTMQSHGIA